MKPLKELLGCNLSCLLNKLPRVPGVYMIFITGSRVPLYIGSSKELRYRLKKHYVYNVRPEDDILLQKLTTIFGSRRKAREFLWKYTEFTIMTCRDLRSARLLERLLIQKYRPILNGQHAHGINAHLKVAQVIRQLL